MSGIQHEYTLNAVTALAFYEPRAGPLLIFVGEGCFLKVFDSSSLKLVTQCKIFNAQTIHGITVSGTGGQDSKIIAALWGGKSFALLGSEDVEAIVGGDVKSLTSFEGVAPDWILDGAISQSQSFSTCVFVTAHSAVLRCDPDGISGKITKKLLQSPSRSILYSAHVIWNAPDSIMVAGGTVFGEIEVNVWQGISVDAPARGTNLYTFTGHEGSVFGVRISPEINGPNGITTRYLASCSDDRTIRVWDISESVGKQGIHESGQKAKFRFRETGFRENENSSMNDSSAMRAIAVKMAHASRIWRVEFISWKIPLLEPTTKVHMLSFGEDSTCQQWSLDFMTSSSELGRGTRQNVPGPILNSASSYPAALTHLKTFSYHKGKHIWSAVLSLTGETSRRLVTGGADGKVAMYNVLLEPSGEKSLVEATKILEHEGEISRPENAGIFSNSWTVEDILHDITPRKKNSEKVSIRSKSDGGASQKSDTLEGGAWSEEETRETAQRTKDMPNRYGFVGEHELLVMTSLGRILLASISPHYGWKELELSSEFRKGLKSYSILLGIPVFGIALLAGATGTIYLYHKKVIAELVKVNGKPAALLKVSAPAKERVFILVTTHGSDTAHRISIATSAFQPPSLEQGLKIKLPSNFIVTNAGHVMGLLILGARNGSIAFYDLENGTAPTNIIPGNEACGFDAVTTIIAIPSSSPENTPSHFLTTSRDGSYSIFLLSTTRATEDSSKKFSISLVHRAFPPLGPMIETAWFNESDLMIYGFRGTSFIVWNETKQCEISSIECGGGHRSYAYMPNIGMGGAGNFAYTKASRLHIHSQAHPSHRVVKPGGHGREIKAAATHKDFIATGAEDTVIRIWRIHKEEGQPQRVRKSADGESEKDEDTSLECCAVLEKHTAGIQHLHWCCSSEEYHSLFSAGGAEEFHVWAISDIPGFGVGVVCEATLTDLSEDRDLRIMGFDVRFIYDNRPRSLDARGSSRGKNEITLIYSDSTIKCYDYSRTTGFINTAQGKYTSACLTQIVYRSKSKVSPAFFTASTDGHLALWDRPQRGNLGGFAVDIHSLSVGESKPQIPELNLTMRLKLHQSSISALAIQHLTLLPECGGLLVASAGDDNAICITFFYNLFPTKYVVMPSAHAAGITGLAFKSDVTGGETEGKWVQLWTVGGDQRVKRWTIEFGVEDEEPKPTMENGLNMRVWGQDEGDDVWSPVADPGGLVGWRDNWDEDHVLVYGNGMEVLKLQDGFPNGIGTRWAGIVEEVRNQISPGDDMDLAVPLHDILSVSQSPM